MSLFTIIVMCMLLYTVVSSLGSGQPRKTWKDIVEFSYHLLLTLCTRFEKLAISIPSWFKVVTGKVVSLIFFMQKGFLLYWTLLGTGPESWVYFEMCKRGGEEAFSFVILVWSWADDDVPFFLHHWWPGSQFISHQASWHKETTKGSFLP